MAFGQLKKLKVDHHTERELTLDLVLKEGADQVVLILTSATEANETYFNALLKSPALKKATRQQQITVKSMKDSRVEDIVLFAKYVIRGWRNVFDDVGKEAAFSAAICEEFLRSLMESVPDVFSAIRTFANEITNFREQVVDVEELAKNS